MARCLEDDDDWLVRANCARSLHWFYLDAEPAVSVLLKALYEDPNPDVRYNAASALGAFRRARREAMREVPELSGDEARVAAGAIGLVVDDDALFTAVNKRDILGVQVLLAAGVDPNTKKHKAVVTAIFSARDADVVHALIERWRRRESHVNIGVTGPTRFGRFYETPASSSARTQRTSGRRGLT